MAENQNSSLKIPTELKRYVIDANNCWIWQGPIDRDGYGKVKFGWQMHQAHRLMYWRVVGDPKGAHVHHKCDVKACVNPAHLELISSAEHNKQHKLKLTTEQEREIVVEYRTKGTIQDKLALRYNVSRGTIYNILNRER